MTNSQNFGESGTSEALWDRLVPYAPRGPIVSGVTRLVIKHSSSKFNPLSNEKAAVLRLNVSVYQFRS